VWRTSEGGDGPPTVTVTTVDDAPALARAAAGAFTQCARDAISARGRCAVALSGGSTPRAMYERLAEPPYRDAIAWSDIHVFWSDERHVPPTHADSNFRMAYDAWLSRVPIPPGNIHRIRAELADARDAADDYEGALREFFQLETTGAFPRFDVVLLGVGSDGHTASLFPGTAALRESTRMAVALWAEQVSAHRVTLTLPMLNAAGDVLFLVSGTAKAAIVRACLYRSRETQLLPAQLVRPPAGRVTWLLDRDAARLLPERPAADASA
jgi:6-phosphogluconolactonase